MKTKRNPFTQIREFGNGCLLLQTFLQGLPFYTVIRLASQLSGGGGHHSHRLLSKYVIILLGGAAQTDDPDLLLGAFAARHPVSGCAEHSSSWAITRPI